MPEQQTLTHFPRQSQGLVEDNAGKAGAHSTDGIDQLQTPPQEPVAYEVPAGIQVNPVSLLLDNINPANEVLCGDCP